MHTKTIFGHQTKTKTGSQTQEKIGYAKIWNVVVYNDPVNLMSYVVMVFQKVLAMSKQNAEIRMLEVHQQGRSIVFSGELEEAENYTHQLQQWQLNACLEDHAHS